MATKRSGEAPACARPEKVPPYRKGKTREDAQPCAKRDRVERAGLRRERGNYDRRGI